VSGDFLLVGMKEHYCERTLVWTRGKIDDKKWIGVWNFEKRRVLYLSKKSWFLLSTNFVL
jgi:hypothetical protein